MRKIVFLTATRADFGKLKSLIDITSHSKKFEVHIFATGMHMNPKYGKTVNEIELCGFHNIFKFYNHGNYDSMDLILSRTIEGFSGFVNDIKPDLIVIHGDRVETLAGAIVGALNNILTAHIEGGELSGTIDELIRHSVTKLSHIHFVANEEAKRRVIQLGEIESSVFVIGSPDIDVMLSDKIPPMNEVKRWYEIPFNEYAILVYHPVTTEPDLLRKNVKNVLNAVLKSGLKYVVIYPNNDHGTEIILEEYEVLKHNPDFKIFPSMRFEYFLTLLKNSLFIIGNSSAGIRETGVYGVGCINIGTRQKNRGNAVNIINVSDDEKLIHNAINQISGKKFKNSFKFGDGNSIEKFFNIINGNDVWDIPHQKIFNDIV
ncbi:MAG: UDP-N-acetyl-D-glucosamine 2-epimerase, UDP-hydrolysing [Ignavibacteria bacterium GWB2_35_12]|nr:MAG: UDP-N-acetyl-D-glucosamine 2-epimerase, UDP-hydrolysing [Ignavibacteria bacterium GWA2_35_8]OGU41898.1 MAG: UDP-N-acetyl-D-glucosamine 2-epimerase, UDP-hydrolysing [Ignavibacteria bacterium GWB2_35_12]OGU87195.1 MAG: UDP-N-acetyl-D-glucosamine 2-epimerase, UDP-hydrolysing [Ignavibacteria bacterium RIFOXYA2_FULL_35_10]OGV24572.1 MAG: UDP-N-acetyl-D-glucosamine 2-epimerase, UDP-hydrolysing [Ignavibacteria bacterium RIFOXYC2_FULL_35_21]